MKSDVVCKPFTFKTVGKSYSSLMNRYKLGKVLNSRLSLDQYECAFLLSTGRIVPEGGKSAEQILSHFENSEDFVNVFTIYFSLKKAGFYAKVSGREIEVRKNVSDKPLVVHAGRDTDDITFCYSRIDDEKISAVVDMDGDITIFGVSEVEIDGEVNDFRATSRTEIKSRIIHEPESIPEWSGYEKGKIRFLSDIEYFSMSNGEIQDNSDPRLKVYTDLSGKGLILKSGFKYGADFRAYRKLESEHAEFLVTTVGSAIEWSRLSRLVRVANAVRKIAILACTSDNSVSYLRIRRLKDFNALYSDQIWASKSSTVD